MNKICILSGGLDSTILLYHLVKIHGHENVIALSFLYGQRHSKEIECAKTSCKKLDVKHHIIDISFLSDIIKDVSALASNTTVSMPKIQDVLGNPQPPTYVPYRNMIMVSLAFSFAESNGADEICSGLQSNDEYNYWDTTQYFIDAINKVSELNRTSSIKYLAPYANLTKANEIGIAQTLNVPLEDTWTCYRGEIDSKACGTCPSCAERIHNFMIAKVKDPVEYEIDIDWGF